MDSSKEPARMLFILGDWSVSHPNCLTLRKFPGTYTIHNV